VGRVSFLARGYASLLADEMGLGKTVQSIIALRLVLHNTVSKRALIIMPASLVYNWERELFTWAPELSYRRVMGTAKDRRATYQLPIQVLIATYEQIRIDALDMDPSVNFEVVVLDEGQRIKNRYSRSALACRLLNRCRSWVLTEHPRKFHRDLGSVFLFLKPGLIDMGCLRLNYTHESRIIFSDAAKKIARRASSDISKISPLSLSGSQEEAYTELWFLEENGYANTEARDRNDDVRLNNSVKATMQL